MGAANTTLTRLYDGEPEPYTSVLRAVRRVGEECRDDPDCYNLMRRRYSRNGRGYAVAIGDNYVNYLDTHKVVPTDMTVITSPIIMLFRFVLERGSTVKFLR